MKPLQWIPIVISIFTLVLALLAFSYQKGRSDMLQWCEQELVRHP